MKQTEIFGSAKWISATPEWIDEAPVFRKSFEAKQGESARLRIIGLGTYEAYLNGKRISDEYFLPLNSEYEDGCGPEGEELYHRIWCTEFDVSDMICDGKNTLAVLVGDGWYSNAYYKARKAFGEKKLCFALNITDGEGNSRSIVSDENVRWKVSFVKHGRMHRGEFHDFREWSDSCLLPDYDDSEWETSRISKPVDSDYGFCDCPSDRIMAHLPATLCYECEEYKIYDAGLNLSGYPVLVSTGEFGDEIKVTFSEELTADGRELDERHAHNQFLDFISDGTDREMHTTFTWHGFRYFKVIGNAVAKEVCLIHADVDINSGFDSDNEVLNWTYNTFLHTQLCNMHRGIPSDCPHIERMGYTGDGQVACRSVMHTLDAKKFYEKWIKDISDCQDRKTGHVQYTAPFARCGGGPGGWGCAIVVVPYEFWKYYGDDKYIRELYPQMLRYFDFLDAHSECHLVTSDIEGVWCLGEWCTPPDQSNLPAPYVNTYFYIWAMQRTIEIAKAIGKEEDVPALEARIAPRLYMMEKVYGNTFQRDSTFCGNVQGANAYALNIGLKADKTEEKLINYYDRLGYYDTGIFSTELVTRKLFELGAADVAFKLLTASEPWGFGKWAKEGATTFREYWGASRSHSHPMFGGVVACFFEYILGIRQEKDSIGYDKVVISPAKIEKLGHASGHITTPHGKICVSYEKKDGKTSYKVEIPAGVEARIAIGGVEETTVGEGIYEFNA